MDETRPSILIVEDDHAIASGLALNLRLEGFDPHEAADGEMAMRAIAELRPDLILLDISLPKKDGLEVLRELRQGNDSTPVIVLSARQDEFDKVAALRIGADDYVTKPFGVAELLARIESVLRRSQPRSASEEETGERIRFGEISLDIGRREVRRGDEPVSLTHLEFELLSYLCRHAGRVFRRQELLNTVWGVRHEGSPRTVDNFVAQLRTKLEPNPSEPRHIVTVRGSGYRFDA